MHILYLFLMVIAGYLSGSLSWAIIITRLATGKEIRELGNKNAGTSNVKRSVGIQYAVVVFILDIAKGVVPMFLARRFIFPGEGYFDILAVFAIGMAAVAGHCRPVYFGFRGGGGIATSLGVYCFFVPVEFSLSLCIAGVIVILFIKNVKHRLTQWMPIMFVTFTPFLNLAVHLSAVDVPLLNNISLGGHGWPVATGTIATSLFILWMNLSFMGKRAEEYREGG